VIVLPWRRGVSKKHCKVGAQTTINREPKNRALRMLLRKIRLNRPSLNPQSFGQSPGKLRWKNCQIGRFP
jgi:hypothetical protein